MYSLLVLATLPLAALAAVNGRCTGGQATGSWGSDGICISTGSCTSFGGKYKSGACPSDGDNIKCCLIGITPAASTNPCGAYSWCTWTANGCAGNWVSDKCPGGSNYKCCHV